MAFMSWLDAVADIKYYRTSVNRSLKRMSHRLLYSAFATWCEDASEAIRERNIVGQIISRIRNRYAAMAFESWREYLARLAFARHCITKMRSFTMARAFNALYDNVLRSRAAKELLGKLLARMRTSFAAAALRGWAAAASEQIERRGRARLVILRMVNMRLSAAFSGWLYRIHQFKDMIAQLEKVKKPCHLSA